MLKLRLLEICRMRDNEAVTASDYRPMGKIDSLPPAIKAAVIDGLLQGRPLRDLATLAGVSPNAVLRFRNRVVIPALQAPAQPKRRPAQRQHNGTADSNLIARQDLSPAQTSTRDLMRTSPARERQQVLQARVDRCLDKAEADGKLFPLMPGLLNQGHKNLELMAKLTGELQDGRGGGGPAVAIQIVYHGAQAPEVAMHESGTIDAPGIKIGIRSQS